MATSWQDLSTADLARIVATERAGAPFVAYRRGGDELTILTLTGERVVIGRDEGNDLSLRWDREVSRVHALLERLAGSWTVVDDDLSRNGTFVNGQRVRGRRRLADRDTIRVGGTLVLYRDPSDEAGETARPAEQSEVAGITPGQRRVLIALCSPFLAVSEPGATPPSNSELAAELGVSTEAVRTHLKALFRLFELPDLPQNRKRAELARRAIAAGVVSPRDLAADP